MNIIVAGGGTGGHVYPALAVILGLQERLPGVHVGYVGTRHGLEARVLPGHPWVRFFPIHSKGLERRGFGAAVRAALWLFVSLVESAMVLLRFRPRLVIGVGGYSSFAPVFLAALLGRVLPIRTAVHEQNAVAGLANRWLSRWVDLVLVSYPTAKGAFPLARRVAVTGNPVRDEFLQTGRTEEGYRLFGLDPQRRTVLVFGGSNGSPELVQQILDSKAEVAESRDLQILLVTGGARSEDAVRAEMASAGVKNVVVRGYIEEMSMAFAVADLIVARAGATTLAEITTCGKPAILVPWSEAADNHQWENARILEREQACRLADSQAMVRHGLVGLVLELVRDDAALSRLAGNAGRLGQRQAKTLILGEIQTLLRGARA